MKIIRNVTIMFTLFFMLAGCSQETQELVVYSGRSKPLVDGIVSDFESNHDINVEVKYGKDAQLLAAIQEEGDQSPADVYWANTMGALKNAVKNDLLTELPISVLQRANRFTPQNGKWVPVTTRFRVLAYNKNNIDPSNLPDSVLDLPNMNNINGKVGWTPTYSSFQDFLTVLRNKKGDEVTREWLNKMQELNPKDYTSNTPMIQALEAGEIDLALTNHYYVLRLKHGGAEGEYEGHEEDEEAEEDEEESVKPDAPVGTYYFREGDPGNLALVTGAGILSTSQSQSAGRQYVQFLLSKQAQKQAAQSVNEYPVIQGTTVPDYMLPVEEALNLSPELSPQSLRGLDGTLEIMREEGII